MAQLQCTQKLLKIDRAKLGNFGDVKPVGEGVSEMRIFVGKGYSISMMPIRMMIPESL